MDMEDSFTQMETCMKDSGKMIRLMGLAIISIWMVRNMRGIGEMTSKMVRGQKRGLMGQNS